jgi:hypothetical protein
MTTILDGASLDFRKTANSLYPNSTPLPKIFKKGKENDVFIS